MAPMPIIPIFAIFMAFSFAALIIICALLARSAAGRWIIGLGALMVLMFLGLSVPYWLMRPRHVETAEVEDERLIRVEYGQAIPVQEAHATTLQTERVVGDLVAPVESGATSTENTATPPQPPAAPQPAAAAAAQPKSEPIRKQTAGAGRPSWMDEPMGKHDGVFRTIATAGPYSTPQECREKLNEAIQGAIEHYVNGFLPRRAGVKIDLPPSFIHNQLVRGEWLEQSEYSVGPMYNLHALLVFDQQANQEIDRQYHEGQVKGRLAYAGAGAGLVLALISTLFGYLKLDTLTRGYYTGRLRVAAGAAILALAAVAGLLAQGNIGF
jgi:hypothetical protein